VNHGENVGLERSMIDHFGTHEDERTVLFKTISLDGIKPNTNPKTNPKINPSPNTNPIQLLYAFSSTVR